MCFILRTVNKCCGLMMLLLLHRSSDGTSSFLSFWDGLTWSSLDSNFDDATNVTQLTMVPLQDTHSANSIIEQDRMLLVTGNLQDSSFGNASAVLFDGQSFIPYIVSSSTTGTPGVVSQLFRSLSTFSFTQQRKLSPFAWKLFVPNLTLVSLFCLCN